MALAANASYLAGRDNMRMIRAQTRRLKDGPARQAKTIMDFRRVRLGRSLLLCGTALFSLGILLLLIKLVMVLAWYGSIVALAGLVLAGIGYLLRRH